MAISLPRDESDLSHGLRPSAAAYLLH